MTITATQVSSRSLMGEDASSHIDPQDVERYLALARAGVLAHKPSGNCGAVQDNMALRHDTRTTLTRASE